jgi:hypothetical protein
MALFFDRKGWLYLTICKVYFTFGKPNFTSMKLHILFSYWCRYLGWGLVIAHIPITMIGRMNGMTNPLDNPGGNTGRTSWSSTYGCRLSFLSFVSGGLFFSLTVH